MESDPITSWQIEGENTEAETDFIFWAPKSLFSHCSKSSRAHIRFPKLEIQQRDWEPIGNLTSKATGIWLQNFHRAGEIDSWRAQKNLVHTRTQDKGAVIPQETEPDLLVSVQDSLAKAWLTVAWCGIRGTEYNSPHISLFEGGNHYLYHSLASDLTTGRRHSPANQHKIGLRFAEYVSTHQSKTQIHNYRKLTKLIPWITALYNSVKLWAMWYRVSQDGWVMVESSDKM